ncbi:hypothetical protein PGAG_00249 [Phaeocystis globosa virus 12T]|uniref:Uncharacterized protein n=1 Tax=Phaeocystis globosa virus PgV-16T TaxID=3071227 RepID=A0AC59EXM9_9VIRU|nr:hypothetical protein PGCG_00288 [Phaeocystis globosa virus]AET73138.1 hypothetical protein PGAG_00249 [Phaeocystis globosa virus 12T]AET73962.1 hypothetical protein PGBG_00254 [Phaeocystis globosa virus 14T]AGM15599.1 hypothetical protein PGCG_00288 [Phaeocystis globosa virus PgV-16T]UYE94329.1 MIF4G domain-containing protein [Phaeocystis globosa virus]
MSPLTYEIEFIMELSKNIPEKHLNNDVENYLNNILIDIKKSSNNNTAPVFKNNSHHKNNKNVRHFKNNNRRHPTYNKDANATEKTIVSKTSPDKEVVSKDSIEKNLSDKLIIDKPIAQNYRINRMCYINNKSDYDMIITNIRKILNKITEQTYQKLKNEFLCYYKSIYKDISSDDLDKINVYIFESLVYNNIPFNNLYSDLLNDLIVIDPKFTDILNDNLEIFYNVYKYTKLPDSIDYDEISITNKHNDRYKCLCGFYIFCSKIKLVPEKYALDSIANLQKELMVNIKLEGKKEYNELLSQFIFFIVSNITLTSKEDKIVKNIEYLAGLTSKSDPSISNKIIFKHKDMMERNIKYNTP